MLIYEISSEGRSATAQYEACELENSELPTAQLRVSPIGLPAVSELQVVRHDGPWSRSDEIVTRRMAARSRRVRVRAC